MDAATESQQPPAAAPKPSEAEVPKLSEAEPPKPSEAEFRQRITAHVLEQLPRDVPRVVHQTWATDEVPAAWKGAADAWRALAADAAWEYRFWTDAANVEFLEAQYPWLVEFYQKLLGVQRAHLMRYLYMYHFGGIYADLDVLPRAGFRTLIDHVMPPNRVLLCERAHRDGVDAGLFASAPKHPLWNHAVYYMPRGAESYLERTFKHVNVTQRTGFAHLTRQLAQFRADCANVNAQQDIVVVPAAWCNGDDSPFLGPRAQGGPTWREWDSSAVDSGMWCWRNRDLVLAGVVVALLCGIILFSVLRKSTP